MLTVLRGYRHPPNLTVNIAEANYLLPPPDTTLTTTDLIAQRAITLQKQRDQLANLQDRVYGMQVKAAIKFEEDHANTIHDFDFKLGDLVLVWNTVIERALNRKMRPQYLGPLIVLARNKGGAYIIAELNGLVFDRPIAAFCIILYFTQTMIQLLPLDDLLDISKARLQELQDSMVADPDNDNCDNVELLPDD